MLSVVTVYLPHEGYLVEHDTRDDNLSCPTKIVLVRRAAVEAPSKNLVCAPKLYTPSTPKLYTRKYSPPTIPAQAVFLSSTSSRRDVVTSGERLQRYIF